MAQCNWDPKKHGGKPCPVHGGGGLWDENVFTRNEKLKKAGYTKEDLEDEDLKEDFDGDYDSVFEEAIEKIGDGQINASSIAKASDGKITEEQARKKIEQEDELEDYPMGESEDEKPYDFDKWASESGSKKENHIAYIDTNKTYKPQDIFDIIVSDNDNWQVEGTIHNGGQVLFKHKTGPTYTYDKNTGKVELTTKDLENKKGQEAHTKELTEYIKNRIEKGAKDPEQIYQSSPYSIHSHDEMIKIANSLLKK